MPIIPTPEPGGVRGDEETDDPVFGVLTPGEAYTFADIARQERLRDASFAPPLPDDDSS